MTLVIKAEIRKEVGKNAAGRLRRQGLVPAILYGGGTASQPLTLKKKDILEILKSQTGENTIFRVTMDSQEKDVMLKDIQINPVTDELTHVDLIEISMDKPVRVAVPVELVGEPVGVKVEGGVADFLLRELEVECLPREIPESIKIDISNLHIHQSIKVQNLDLPAGVKVYADPNAAIVVISSVAQEAAPAPTEEVIEGAEAKEPELIRKERKKEEEEQPKES
ncbi:MAG TPA: 50S ribosomal protein L25 [Candidatus Saccharicenans sp.]|nr:50S ribosomal protein L25 [Candidatus Saccharicenans sp.]HOL45460.1 50S ribosomal protein L25 [Candidatus Saccharicenans sp.]HOM94376.1 50S ribosomal protein L25 [Candidatus Saccharicenans sp.]HOT68901.1 50S ribosomal protein L25 [Candidatus Saccharicenans sp.]HPC88129.1 50S ribosomal protein L25 [Candidatus Saccharicenans sp.]